MSGRDVPPGRAVEATRAPLNRASNLPAFCYTSPEWYAREIERIFLKERKLPGESGPLVDFSTSWPFRRCR